LPNGAYSETETCAQGVVVIVAQSFGWFERYLEYAELSASLLATRSCSRSGRSGPILKGTNQMPATIARHVKKVTSSISGRILKCYQALTCVAEH
jgi:hypothetical protein